MSGKVRYNSHSLPDPDLSAKAESYLRAARSDLVIEEPFYGCLSLKLRLKATLELPTLGTDGTYLYFNPQFVIDIGNPLQGRLQGMQELKGLWCHEVTHCAVGHPWRLIDVEPGPRKLVAMDLSINPMIRESGKVNSRFKLPDDGQWPADYGLSEGLSAEEYYRLLEGKVPDQSDMEAGMTQCSCSGVIVPGQGPDGTEEGEGDGEGEGTGQSSASASASALAELESSWTVAIHQAVQAAKSDKRGTLPGWADRLVQEMREPVVDWREVLKRFMTEQSKDDYVNYPSNRRYVHRGLYLPSLHNTDTMGEVVVAVDTSGSIGREVLAGFMAEVNGICEDLRPRIVTLVGCDAQISYVRQYTPDEYPIQTVNLGGGGGTDFIPVFDWIRNNLVSRGTVPACLVYLTDMYGGSWPVEKEEGYPVLWVATTDVVAPESAGETVRMKG